MKETVVEAQKSQLELAESAENATDIIIELGIASAAAALAEERILSPTDADEMIIQSIGFILVGWVKPIPAPNFVGFRCTQSNLLVAGAIEKCETQHRPISEPSPNNFFFNQTGRTRIVAAL